MSAPQAVRKRSIKKKNVVIPVIIIILFVGWYWFRPERLIINRRVDEGFPTSNESPAQILESGAFHNRGKGHHLVIQTNLPLAFPTPDKRHFRQLGFNESQFPEIRTYQDCRRDGVYLRVSSSDASDIASSFLYLRPGSPKVPNAAPSGTANHLPGGRASKE